MKYGYARVSTSGQSVAAQVATLRKAGAATIYRETISGVAAARPQLSKAVAKLRAGDVLMVTRLDRVARSTLDLLHTIERIQVAGAALRSLSEAWINTTTPQGRLFVTFLAGFAQFERDLIRERTAEGRARAKAEGRSLGRKPKLSPHQRGEIFKRLANGEGVRALASSYGVSPSTISRLKP